MTLLELNDCMQHPKGGHREVVEITNDDVNEFMSLISINNASNSLYEVIDDAGAFYALFPDIKKIIGNKKCIEVFYAAKLGYVYKDVPGKLVYTLTELFKLTDKINVNKSLNTAVSLLSTYVDFTYGADEFTVKDIIENILGKPVSLITDYSRKVKVGDYWEVWIPDKKEVALIPDDIASQLSADNLEDLSFEPSRGIMLKDIPLRTFNGRVGCTLNDFDLTSCF